MRLDPPFARPGDEVRLHVTDRTPWTYVLLTVNGSPVRPESWGSGLNKQWTWTFRFVLPTGPSEIVFYRNCNTGCAEQGRMVLGEAPVPPSGLIPTKLGLVFPNLERDWHGRSGWAVELTYARQAEKSFWGIDDLAARVYKHHLKGLRVLVRVDYDYGQAIPPAGDHLALAEHLDYLARLARDDRLRDVYGYILGSGYNGLDLNGLAPDRPVTPEWYARMFNGYANRPTTPTTPSRSSGPKTPGRGCWWGRCGPGNTDQMGPTSTG
jgi:hypothetical protein